MGFISLMVSFTRFTRVSGVDTAYTHLWGLGFGTLCLGPNGGSGEDASRDSATTVTGGGDTGIGISSTSVLRRT